MVETDKSWSKTIFWGALVGLLYWALFHNVNTILHFAHTTGHACVVNQGGELVYFAEPTVDACAAKNGTMVQGNWLHVFIPILIAFAVSYVHGAFTSSFWDSIGFKAAPKKNKGN